MKPVVVCYVPPPNYGHGEAFLKNVRHWRTDVPLLIYSDHEPWKPDVGVPSPEHVKRRGRAWLVNNLVFLTGLQIARQHGYTHFLYLEEDCRVFGDGWAERVLTEFESFKGAVMGGTPVVWNPMASGPGVLKNMWENGAAHRSRPEAASP